MRGQLPVRDYGVVRLEVEEGAAAEAGALARGEEVRECEAMADEGSGGELARERCLLDDVGGPFAGYEGELGGGESGDVHGCGGGGRGGAAGRDNDSSNPSPMRCGLLQFPHLGQIYPSLQL